MKIKAIFIALAAVTLLTACEDKLSEREKMDSRTVSQLDVQYALGGKTVQTLSFDHSYTRAAVEVNVSIEGLRWNMESNRNWCKVIQENHQGSGTVTLELEANESLEDRTPATLTFIAGDFRGFQIDVEQSASTFILSQPYFVAGVPGAAISVDVTTPADCDWDFEADDWIPVSRQPAVNSGEGEVTTTLKINLGTNYDGDRLGSVKLSDGTDMDAVWIWQFGPDNWSPGCLHFPSEKSSFSLVIPHHLLLDVVVPDFAGFETASAGEGLDRLVFTIPEFISDALSPRDVPISVVLSNSTSSVVALPSIKQDYKSAGALMSADGLKTFAQKVAAGESTAEWEKDGWVTVIQDIDMKGVNDWAGIGTKDHPFKGKFDGGGFSVKNLVSASHGLFNYCEGESESSAASIKDIKMAKSSSFYCNAGEWTGGASFGAIAANAVNTRFENCVNEATIEFDGTGDDSPAWVGGILGKGGEGVSLRSCRTTAGSIYVSASAPEAYVGGIAGACQSIRGCSMNGTVVGEGTFTTIYIGGITSVLGTGSVVGDNSFKGKINVKGNNKNNYAGGLYGAVEKDCEYSFDSASDMSVAGGSISVNNYLPNASTRVFAGGFIGYAASGATLSFKDYEVQTSFLVDGSANRQAGYCCCGGVLGACDPSAKVKSLTFENIIPQGSVSIQFGASVRTGIVHGLYGGVAGFVNGPASFTGCVNKGIIGQAASSQTVEGASFNGSLSCVGGLAGYCEGGDISFTSCKNEATVTALFYVNNVGISTCLSDWVGECAGGIIGCYDMHSSASTAKLTLQECENTGMINAYRGFAGGMAGFCRNATVTQCTNTGRGSSSSNGYVQGGIAGCVLSSSFSNCTARTDVRAGAGGNANDYGCNAGGILGRVEGSAETKVTSCSFYGEIDAVLSAGKPRNGGGLVGYAPSTTVISNCTYGGEVNGTTVTEAKLADLAVGGGGATHTGTTLWKLSK